MTENTGGTDESFREKTPIDWEARKQEAVNRDGGCLACGETTDLYVGFRTPISEMRDEQLKFSVKNLKTLCGTHLDAPHPRDALQHSEDTGSSFMGSDDTVDSGTKPGSGNSTDSGGIGDSGVEIKSGGGASPTDSDSDDADEDVYKPGRGRDSSREDSIGDRRNNDTGTTEGLSGEGYNADAGSNEIRGLGDDPSAREHSPGDDAGVDVSDTFLDKRERRRRAANSNSDATGNTGEDAERLTADEAVEMATDTDTDSAADTGSDWGLFSGSDVEDVKASIGAPGMSSPKKLHAKLQTKWKHGAEVGGTRAAYRPLHTVTFLTEICAKRILPVVITAILVTAIGAGIMQQSLAASEAVVRGAATTVMSTSNTIVSSQALLSLCAVAVYAVALLYRDVWSVYPATRTPDSMPGFDGDYAKRFRGSAAGVLIGAGLVTASSSGVVTGTALYAMQGAGYAVYLVGAVMAMIAVADSQVADCAAGTARAPALWDWGIRVTGTAGVLTPVLSLGVGATALVMIAPLAVLLAVYIQSLRWTNTVGLTHN